MLKTDKYRQRSLAYHATYTRVIFFLQKNLWVRVQINVDS